jgi:hypothetical protein
MKKIHNFFRVYRSHNPQVSICAGLTQHDVYEGLSYLCLVHVVLFIINSGRGRHALLHPTQCLPGRLPEPICLETVEKHNLEASVS